MNRLSQLALVLGTMLTAGASAAHADDVLNSHPWDYRVHRSAIGLAKALSIKDADRRQGGYGGGAGSQMGGGFPSGVVSVGNMNIVTVSVGEGGTADVAVEAEQDNTGNIDATAVAATGNTVTVGDIKSSNTNTAR